MSDRRRSRAPLLPVHLDARITPQGEAGDASKAADTAAATPLASDSYASLFQTLRAQLSAQVVHAERASSSRSRSDAPPRLNARPAAAAASPSPATPESELLGLAVQRAPELRAALQLQTLERTRSRVRELRHRRLGVRVRREARALALAQQQRAVGDDCALVVGVAKAQATRYAALAQQSLARANQRLQTLLFECVAETRTALDRLERLAASEAPEAAESAVLARARARQLEWDVFLTRLQRDLNGAVSFTQLFPSVRGGADSDDGLEAKMRAVLIRNGPVLPPNATLQLRRVVAVARSGAAPPPENKRAKPSLLFGDSGPDVWANIARAALRAAAAAGSDARRPTGRRVQSSASAQSFATSRATSSEIRQLPAASTLQFPRTECDVPLSSACIRWLLKDADAAASASRWVHTADANVYFDLEELERGLAVADDGVPTCVAGGGDPRTAASITGALSTANSVLERTRRDPSARPVPANVDVLLARRDDPLGAAAILPRRQMRFARASVLQLLQTAYFTQRFLPQLSASDAAHLERLYPSTRCGANVLSTLFVPCSGADGDANADSEPEVVVVRPSTREIVMRALDDVALHELLLLFVARGRRESAAAGSRSGRQVASLAISDAISELYPRHPDQRDEDDAARSSVSECSSPVVYQCAITNPGSLWKQQLDVAAALRSADHLYVEYQVSQDRQRHSNQTSALDAIAQIRSALDGGCSWRACLAPPETTASRQRDSRERSLCAWHGVLEQQLAGAEESEQYLSRTNASQSGIVSALERDSSAEALRRVVVKSSSLLDELASRQLGASIASFFDHLKLSLSNRAFERDSLSSRADPAARRSHVDPTCPEPQSHQSGIEDLEATAKRLSQVLTLERSCTTEFQRFAQLTAHPGADVSAIRRACLELQEFDADIRADDAELLLRLGTRKLLLLRRRREEEESRASLRAAMPPSTQNGGDPADTQDATASVYDVIHRLRKGSKSLRDQQEQGQRGSQTHRPHTAGSNRPGPTDKVGLSRSVSEVLQQARELDWQCHAARRLEARRAANGVSGHSTKTQRK